MFSYSFYLGDNSTGFLVATGPVGTFQFISCRTCGMVRLPFSSQQLVGCWSASWQVSDKFYYFWLILSLLQAALSYRLVMITVVSEFMGRGNVTLHIGYRLGEKLNDFRNCQGYFSVIGIFQFCVRFVPCVLILLSYTGNITISRSRW